MPPNFKVNGNQGCELGEKVMMKKLYDLMLEFLYINFLTIGLEY